MTPTNPRLETSADFSRLRELCTSAGADAMFEALASTLTARRRWHALFDARLMQARVALGLPPSGDVGNVPAAVRDRLDERSLAACREAGWPLLEEGQVAAAWMYLRAAAEPDEMAGKLAALAAEVEAAPETADDEETARRLQEILGVALWEGAAPALGIALVLRTQGTCNAVTAYEQALSRLPAARQEPAADVLVAHLHREVAANLATDLARRGLIESAPAEPPSIAALLDAAGGLVGDASVHVDVSHLQSVLRIARVCTTEPSIRRGHELARYACRLPEDFVYPGEPPFENVGEASRHWFGAQLGIDVERALAFFRSAAVTAKLEESGTLPSDTLVLLLARLGRPAEALHAALERPAGDGMPSTLQAAGMLPSLVDLARAAGEWETLRRECERRGDEITFAATLAAERCSPRQPV